MTYIQEVLSNLLMIERLISALTPEDLSTKEGKKMWRQLKRMKARYEGAVRSFDYVGGKNV